MASEAPAIQAEHLSRSFGKLVAVDDVSFAVPPAAVFGFLGPNGSGKTTIVRMLCGVLRPTGGHGMVLGRDVAREAEAVKREIGYMSQKFSLYSDLTVEENLEFYGRIYGLRGAALLRRRRALMEMVHIQDRERQLAGTLSGGWKQRLALACALIHEPKVLFLDEPTAGIDPVARRELWDLLFDLSARGVTLFVTTHYMDEAERCTHVGYIHMSKLIAWGRPDELKDMPQITPPGTRRVELVCQNPVRVIERLRGLAGVREVALFGESVHLLLDEAAPDANLLAAAREFDPDATARPATASLEDVFVTLSRMEASRRKA